jgi:hypothetical protein
MGIERLEEGAADQRQILVCAENLIRFDDVMESPKLAE